MGRNGSIEESIIFILHRVSHWRGTRVIGCYPEERRRKKSRGSSLLRSSFDKTTMTTEQSVGSSMFAHVSHTVSRPSFIGRARIAYGPSRTFARRSASTRLASAGATKGPARMTAQPHQPNPCENMNHRRDNAPVAHCPQCGGIVNPNIRVAACSEAEHALARRQQSMFCVHCGALLIA